MNIAGLRILKGKIKPIKIFGFDIETYNNNKNFLCASIVGKDYSFYTEKKEELITEFLTNRIFRNSFITATNLMFDFFAMFNLKDVFKHFDIIERAGSLVLAVSYINYQGNQEFHKKGFIYNNKLKTKDFYKITFIDSKNHLNVPLFKLGKIINQDKLPTPKFIGHKPSNKEEWQEMKTYNINDSTVTYKFMEWLQTVYNGLGGNLKVTVSSSSMDLFRRKYLKRFIPQEKEEIIKLGFKGYKGGRTEVFKRGLFNKDNYGKLLSYDVNSLYPYCMKTFEFPYPIGSYYKKKVSSEEILSYNGVAKVKLKIPKDNHIPILSIKTDKLIFPTGTIEDYYDFSSLRYALNDGAEIVSIGEGTIYEHTFNPFKNFITSLYKKRMEFQKNNNLAEIGVKLMMNSSYGKFGYKYDEKEILIDKESLEDYWQDTIFPTRDDNIFRIVKDNAKIPSYVFPIFPVYVTSLSRQVMHKHFKKVGYDKVFYSDTDCIFTTRKLNTSSELGELKLENKFDELMIIKPKFYAGLTEEKEIMKVKGLMGSIDTYKQFKEMVSTNKFSVNRRHFRKLRSAIGFNNKWVNEIYMQGKTLDLNDNKRLWDKEKFGLTPQNSIPLSI